MKLIIKAIVILILIGCFFPMTYNYYTLTKTIVFTLLLVHSIVDFKNVGYETYQPYVTLAVAILFNPIKQFHFERSTWLLIDVYVLSIFVLWFFYDLKKYSERIAASESLVQENE